MLPYRYSEENMISVLKSFDATYRSNSCQCHVGYKDWGHSFFEESLEIRVSSLTNSGFVCDEQTDGSGLWMGEGNGTIEDDMDTELGGKGMNTEIGDDVM